MSRKRGKQHHRPGISKKRTRTPLLERVVGTTSGVLALAVAPLFFLASVVSTVVLGTYNDVAMPALAVGATALLLGLGLALVNAIGVRPWIDESGQFARPTSTAEWAVKILALASALLFLVSITPLGATVAMSGDEGLSTTLGIGIIGGLLASVLLAAISGVVQIVRTRSTAVS